MKATRKQFRVLIGKIVTSVRRVPLLSAFVAGLAGIVVVDRDYWFAGGLVFFLLLTGLLILGKRHRAFFGIGLGCLVAMALMGWRHQERLSAIAAFPLEAALSEGGSVEVIGEGWISDLPDYGTRSVSTSVHLVSLTIGSLEVPCDHRVPAWIQKVPEGLSYGTVIQFTGRLVALEAPVTPGGFDARAFYFRQSGSLARLEIREGDEFTILPGNRGSRIVGFAQGLRKELEDALLRGVSLADEPYARLIAAMSLGARENSPEELEELFRQSGTMHLFAVSGMHVGIVAGLLLGLVMWMRIPKHYAVLVVIPLILFYAVLTGLRPSAVRASLMLSVFLFAYALREKPQLLNSLGFAGLAILLYDSQQLFLPGFQLSFAVLLFIALFASSLRTFLAGPFLVDAFVPKSLVKPFRLSVDRISGAIAAALAVSVTSWLGSAGLLSWHFHSLAPIGIVANVIMVPLAGVIIGLATLSLSAFGLQVSGLVVVANQLNVGVAILLAALAQFFAEIPGAFLHTGQVGIRKPDPSVLRLDIMGERGEGAALLTVPRSDGAPPVLWMIDSGGTRTYRKQVLPLLRSRGINHLDGLVLTHGDLGHIGSAPAVLSQFRPQLLLESVGENRSRVYPEIVATAESHGVKPLAVGRGHRLLVGGEAVCTVLSPKNSDPGRIADDRALVLKIAYRERTFLLTSDTGFDTEKSLLESGTDLRADVWIRGQHSEATSAIPAFVEAINPLAVVSSHSEFPKSEQIPEALRKHLRERGIALYDLSTTGTVTIEVGKEDLRITPFANPSDSLILPR